MKEETAHVITSLEYAHVGDLSVQLQGTYPKSINGLSPLALVKVVYPNNESEEVLMDLVAKQYYVSHGYTLKLNDVDIGTSYLPWRRMFTGAVSLTATSNESVGSVEVSAESNLPAPSVAQCPAVSSLPVVTVTSPAIQTMQTPDTTPQYVEKNDTVKLAIAALGFISLGLLGLAFLLSKKQSRGD